MKVLKVTTYEEACSLAQALTLALRNLEDNELAKAQAWYAQTLIDMRNLQRQADGIVLALCPPRI